MNFPIITTQSAYWLLLIIGIAGLFTYFVYYKKLLYVDLNRQKTIFLSSIRFIVLVFIGFLLLIPIIKISTNEIKKPIVIFAQDNSISMILSKDSTFLRDSFPQLTSTLFNQLSDKYDVRKIQFGDTVSELSFLFDDKESNFEALFNEFNTTYYNQNVGALIIASDGLFNKGVDPIYSSQNLSFPIYTIPFGDTLSGIDLAIKKVEYNEIAYKGTNFPVIVSVSANFIQGKQVRIEIFNGEEVLKSQLIDVSSKNFFKKVLFYLNADTSGVFEYVIKATLQDITETNKLKDTKKIYVEVEENKRKILLLQNGYHPDIAVLKRIIDFNPAFEIDISNPNDFKDKIQDYSLVILHQLPSNEHNLHKILSDLFEYDIPMFFIIGEESSIKAINNLGLLLNINQQNNLFDDVLPRLNEEFILFSVSADNNIIVEMTPMYVPFGVYKNIPQNQVLLYQQIGNIATQKPLWAFVESGKQKVGFILGEGLWNWRLQEYKKYRDHSITNELITKSINYLALKNRISPFLVEFNRTVGENHDILFNSKLFNASNELVKNALINLDVYDEQDNKYKYSFKEMADEYSVNLGSLGVGKYKFKASTKLGTTTFTELGVFIVTENIMEQSDLIANYNILHRLSTNSNGKQYYKNKLSELFKDIDDRTDIAPIIYSIKNFKDILYIKWLFAFLVLLISVEWFFRKFWGVI